MRLFDIAGWFGRLFSAFRRSASSYPPSKPIPAVLAPVPPAHQRNLELRLLDHQIATLAKRIERAKANKKAWRSTLLPTWQRLCAERAALEGGA